MALAKTHISITDDSVYTSGIDALIPLYVFATEQDKVVDETTGEVALGTTKQFANEVTIVTSKKDVIEKFGIPTFVELNGTVQQDNERNEHGLYALYDAMGSTSVAYALRADIDLKQLEPAELEPTSPVKNGTYWLDTYNSSLGLFTCIGGNISSNAWVKVDSVELYDSKPTATDGSLGDYAIWFSEGVQHIEEKTSEKGWVEIGSDDWKAVYTNAKIYHQASIKYPKDYTVNSVWVKTTPINNGANYVLKKYSESSQRWNEVDLPMCVSLVDAEVSYGSSLTNGSLALKCDSKTANATFYKYTGSKKDGEVILQSSDVSANSNKLTIKVSNNGVLKTQEVSGDTIDALVNSINEKLNSYGVYAEKVESTIKIKYTTSTLNITIGSTSTDYINGAWEVFKDVKVSMTEPRDVASEGTLWFNDDLKVDIMVNTGTVWKGYNSMYPNASVYVTSAEPTNETNENSLWINTASNDYPEIRRYIGGEWVLMSNYDQSTPNGVLFADARYYASNNAEPTHSISDSDGKLTSNLLTSDDVDPDCPNPQTYPEDMILFNTRFSTNNVKEYKSNPFELLVDKDSNYSVGGYEGTLTKKARWVSASGNAADGSGLFGKKAQRAMVVRALAGAIVSNEQIRTMDYDFFFATCPGYPEVDDELINLNTDKKEMFEIISDTPKTLEPQGRAIQDWGTNVNNAISHGLDGRVLKNEYVTRQYPPMGLTTNVDGSEIAVPTSVAKMKNLLVLPRGQICAGTQNGQITNLASVGYITEEGEYSSVVINDGLGEICTTQSINPIMPRRNTGLLLWGEATENPITSALSDEHAIITLLRLKRDLEAVCLPFFFRINNESLRSEFYRALQSVLNIYIGTGEIYDYALEVEAENTSERINRKELWAAIAIEIAKGVEQIYIPIRVVSTGALSA